MVTVSVFVDDTDNPDEASRSALARAEAAARRFPNRAEVLVFPLDSEEAQARGALVGPTVAVDDLVVAAGQEPLAGHLVRAIEVALGETG